MRRIAAVAAAKAHRTSAVVAGVPLVLGATRSSSTNGTSISNSHDENWGQTDINKASDADLWKADEEDHSGDKRVATPDDGADGKDSFSDDGADEPAVGTYTRGVDPKRVLDARRALLQELEARVTNARDFAFIAQVSSEVDPESVAMNDLDLATRAVSYLHATKTNVRLVSPVEEAVVFPALLERVEAMSLTLLLDVLEVDCGRSTFVRYLERLGDGVRDRVLREATKLLEEAGGTLAQDAASGEAGNVDPLLEDEAIAREAAATANKKATAVGSDVAGEASVTVEKFSVELVVRSVLVLGAVGGKRKRDLELFQTLGKCIVRNINGVRDPNQLVDVITAFRRAKILPPDSFLALMGRRFPVLNKRVPMTTIAAYRAFINLYRMGHESMNPFRYLADRVLDTVNEQIKAEKKRMLVAQLTALKEQKGAELSAAEAKKALNELKLFPADAPAARRRCQDIIGLKSSMVTKLLVVLARLGAPHQQYLRPLVKPLIIPMLDFVQPPAFSRLIRAVRMFHSTDGELVEAILGKLVRLGPKKVVLQDVLEMLRMLGIPDVPAVRMQPFIQLCSEIFSDDSRLRSRDMIVIASDLRQLSRRDDLDDHVALDAPSSKESSIATLTSLLEHFAGRMAFLMELGVLSLQHADVFDEICMEVRPPDTSGNIARLIAARRQFADESSGGEDAYYMRLDIDVRELYFRTQVLNSYNTFGAYTPLPPQLLVDYKKMLSEMRVDYVVDALALFERAYPSQLILPLQRVVSRCIIAKLSKDGEDVIEDGEYHGKVKKPSVLFTRDAFADFVTKLRSLPIKRVKTSETVWAFVAEKATKLKTTDILEHANAQLAEIRSSSSGQATPSGAGGATEDSRSAEEAELDAKAYAEVTRRAREEMRKRALERMEEKRQQREKEERIRALEAAEAAAAAAMAGSAAPGSPAAHEGVAA